MSLRDRLHRDYEAEAGTAGDLLLAGESVPFRPLVERLKVPAHLAQPGPGHLAIMEAVDQILSFALTMPNADSAPAPMRTMVRLMRRMEGEMLAELAKIPESECAKILRTFGDHAARVADDIESRSADAGRALPAESSQSASA